jgi:L-alanine-DL-glutamate epimerase-like enolase superfamily enzyme
MPVKGGLIDVPDRPGMGVELITKEAKKYLSEGDAGFFD